MFNALLQLLMYTLIKTWIFRVISAVFATVASIVIIFFAAPGNNASAQIFTPTSARGDSAVSLQPTICTITNNEAQEVDKSLWDAANKEQSATLKTLESLVEIQTGTGDEDGLEEIADLLETELEKINGMEVDREEPTDDVVGNIIVGTLEGSKTNGKKLLLIAHMDTVYERVTPEEPLFENNGRDAIGPGVADDKSGIAVILHSLKLLRQNPQLGENTEFPRLKDQDFGKITVLINTDEEKGSKGSSWLIEKLARESDVIFSYEPTQFLSEKSDTELISEGLSGIKTLVATVTGQAAHAGAKPEEGVNALVEASDLVKRTQKLDQGPGKLRFNWTILNSGAVSNVIPDKAVITADIRYPKKEDLKIVEDKLDELAQNTYLEGAKISIEEATNKGGRPPFLVTEKGCRLIQNARDIYKSVGGEIELIGLTGGGSDAGFASLSEKPVIEGLGLPGYGYHTGSTEGVRIEAIPRRLYLSAKMIINEVTGQ